MKRFLILCFLWCGGAIAQPGHTFFIAKIKNHTADRLTIATMQFSHASSFFADSTGTFVCGDLNVQTGIFLLFYNKREILVFIENGTTITMKADENNFIETLAFEGATEKENNCIAQCLREREKFEKSADSLGTDVEGLRKLSYDYSQKVERWLRDKKLDPSFSSTMQALFKNEHDNILSRIETIETVTELEGTPSPGFKFENYAGGTSKLEDFKGKYVLIDVWATWCGPCVYQMPYLEKIQEQYKDKNITFVSISIDNKKDRDKWRKFIADNQPNGTQLMADKGFSSKFAKEYAIKSIPRFIIIDPEGKVVNADAPRPFDLKLQELLDALLTQ